MNLTQIQIRPAQPNDAAFIADMIQLSMGGLAVHLFGTDGRSINRYIENLVLRNAGRFGLRFSFIADVAEISKGFLLSYKGRSLNFLNIATLPQLFLAMGFAPAFRFTKRGIGLPGGREAVKDEYYISNLGVHPSAQGQGVGSALLKFAEGLASNAKLTKCSLIVSQHNQNAFRLYRRFGYQVVETVQDDNPSLGYQRMVKVL
jgi:ribosomal protein S18 acetylase RimI-like enzyme